MIILNNKLKEDTDANIIKQIKNEINRYREFNIDAFNKSQSKDMLDEDKKAAKAITYREVKKDIEFNNAIVDSINGKHIDIPVKIFKISSSDGFPNSCVWYYYPKTKLHKKILWNLITSKHVGTYTYEFNTDLNLYVTSNLKNNLQCNYIIIHKDEFLNSKNILVNTRGLVLEEDKLLKDKRISKYYIRKSKRK